MPQSASVITPSSSSLNVLLTSAGRRVALLRAFRDAQRALGLTGSKVVATDLTRLSSAFQDADAAELVPRVTAVDYVDRLVEVCERHQIGLIVPLIDPELPVLAAARARLEAVGAIPVASGPETAAVSDSKRVAATFFDRIGLRTPRVIDHGSALAGHEPFPLFLKPENGSSSIGTRPIHSVEELAHWWPRTQKPLLLELVTGVEYTVDVYVGLDGTPRCAVPRRRLETRAGEVSKGITVADERVMSAAITAAAALPDARGVLTFQCMVGPDGEPSFFELNARFGGGAPLSIAAGADFPRWLLEERLGRVPAIPSPAFKHHFAMLRFDDAVFVENAGALLPEAILS